jgi:hypothetical protein
MGCTWLNHLGQTWSSQVKLIDDSTNISPSFLYWAGLDPAIWAELGLA